jgi:hypothetical protein
MSLLQTVTSALLLHFIRLLLISSRGSSSLFYKKMGENNISRDHQCMQLTCIFTVTTVTNKIKTLLKSATGKGFRFVTASPKTCRTVTLLLQTVTNCNINCNKRCNIFIDCISISYKKCYSWHPKNLYLRIFHSKNNFNSSNSLFSQKTN